jgi:DNA-binding LytR/AlgR family response regulator
MHILSIPVVRGVIFKDTSRIIRVEASSNYSRIYCTDETHPIIVARVLSWFQQQLPSQEFIRTHRTHLINKRYIHCTEGRKMFLQNGEVIGLSRWGRSELKKLSTTIAISV